MKWKPQLCRWQVLYTVTCKGKKKTFSRLFKTQEEAEAAAPEVRKKAMEAADAIPKAEAPKAKAKEPPKWQPPEQDNRIRLLKGGWSCKVSVGGKVRYRRIRPLMNSVEELKRSYEEAKQWVKERVKEQKETKEKKMKQRRPKWQPLETEPHISWRGAWRCLVTVGDKVRYRRIRPLMNSVEELKRSYEEAKQWVKERMEEQKETKERKKDEVQERIKEQNEGTAAERVTRELRKKVMEVANATAKDEAAKAEANALPEGPEWQPPKKSPCITWQGAGGPWCCAVKVGDKVRYRRIRPLTNSVEERKRSYEEAKQWVKERIEEQNQQQRLRAEAKKEQQRLRAEAEWEAECAAEQEAIELIETQEAEKKSVVPAIQKPQPEEVEWFYERRGKRKLPLPAKPKKTARQPSLEDLTWSEACFSPSRTTSSEDSSSEDTSEEAAPCKSKILSEGPAKVRSRDLQWEVACKVIGFR